MSDDSSTTRGAAGPAPVVFYFDFSSPYSYFAAHKIDDIARLYGREVDWRPMLLGPVFQQSGGKPLLDQPLKGTYSQHDMRRCARALGLPFTFPETFPFPSVAAARAVWWLKGQDEALAHRTATALFDTAFAEGRDIRPAETVVEVAGSEGADTAALSAALQDQAVKDRLRQAVEQAIADGVCGAPFFVVDGEPFWGADRLDHLERWLATGGW
jgi:2-hydroxychromene-2-carboxylate isomerase